MSVTVHLPHIYHADSYENGGQVAHPDGHDVHVDDRGTLTVLGRNGVRRIAGYAADEWARYTVEPAEEPRGENVPAGPRVINMDELRSAELRRQGVVTE